MEKNIIKIQRFYRIYKLSKLFDNFKKYEMNKKNISFEEYTIKMKNKNLINIVNKIILDLNKLCNTSFKIPTRIILTAFLINNYSNDVIGHLKDRHPIDNFVIDWSKKLVKIFKLENNYNENILLIKYLNNYVEIFNNWKNIDKNRTIQNIIISYGNRMEHLQYVEKEELEEESKNKIILSLTTECDSLIQSIKIMDKDFDIDNLKDNYKEIIIKIKDSMEKIFYDLSYNFKSAYLDMLIEEYTNDNNNVILNLIIETNDRILLLTPKAYLDSTRSKFNSYDYTEYLLEDNYGELCKYFNFLIDTIVAYSSPEDIKENTLWKEEMINWLIFDADVDYKVVIPSLLLEINTKIDLLIYKIKNII